MKHNGYIKNGVLYITDRASFNSGLKDLEGDVIVTVEKPKQIRTWEQNKWYFAGVIPIIQDALKEQGIRYTKEKIHDILRYKFLRDIIPIGYEGEFIEEIKSTTDLTTKEFAEYIDEITIWAAEVLKITIPPPKKQTEIWTSTEKQSSQI